MVQKEYKLGPDLDFSFLFRSLGCSLQYEVEENNNHLLKIKLIIHYDEKEKKYTITYNHDK